MYESNKAAENENGAVAAVRTAAQAVSRLPLRDSIEHAVQNYVSSGRNDGSLYEEVLSTMEHPLLDAVMQATRGNQTRAAVLLGINRGTLRKKLKKYGINRSNTARCFLPRFFYARISRKGYFRPGSGAGRSAVNYPSCNL